MRTDLNADERNKLRAELTEALRASRMESMGLAFSHERIRVLRTHMSDNSGFREGDIVHPTNYVRQMSKVYRDTWITGPLERACMLLGIEFAGPSDPAKWNDADIPTTRNAPADDDGLAPFQAEDGLPYLNAQWVTPDELRITCSRPDKAKPFENFLLDAGVGIFTGMAMTSEPAPSESASKTPLKHAALIKEWVDDPSKEIWGWAPDLKDWLRVTVNHPLSYPQHHYALGDKPAKPPRRMCTLAGVEFPEPEHVEPANGTRYWAASVLTGYEQDANLFTWHGDEVDKIAFKAGIIHMNDGAAQEHSRALAAATKQAIEAAK